MTLLDPSANRVYRQAVATLAAAELAVTAPFANLIGPARLAGAPAVTWQADEVDELVLAAQSAQLVSFERVGDLLRPLTLPGLRLFDDDLLTIPKYQGKTNEAFTRMLLHLTLSQISRPGPLSVLDPLAGRGTTLLAAWLAGHHGYGVEADERALDALAGYLKTYLRAKRLKHTAQISPVRRDGRSLGRRLDVGVRLGEATSERPARPGLPSLNLTVFSGDAADSAALFGRRRFDAIVTDAPYGVAHGAESAGRARTGRGGPHRQDAAGRQRDRSPLGLLTRAIGVWASQLKPGGALGIAWNTVTVARPVLIELLAGAGLQVRDEGAWREFAHRVDQAITRDLAVAVRPC